MRKIQFAIMAAGLAVAMSANASMVLVTSPTGADYYNSPPPGSEGFTFTTPAVLTQPTVTQLGVYDAGNNGLGASHVVTLYTAGGLLLTSATVPSGGSATADSFQWVRTTPVTLAPNTTYILAAFYGGDDPDHFLFGSATLPAGFTLGNAVWASGTGAPDQVWGSGGFFGPNLSAVPEPTTMVAGAGALGFALLGIGRARRSGVVRIGK